jgi:hypothetical protein
MKEKIITINEFTLMDGFLCVHDWMNEWMSEWMNNLKSETKKWLRINIYTFAVEVAENLNELLSILICLPTNYHTHFIFPCNAHFSLTLKWNIVCVAGTTFLLHIYEITHIILLLMLCEQVIRECRTDRISRNWNVKK